MVFLWGILKLWNCTCLCIFVWDSRRGLGVQGGPWYCHQNNLFSHNICPGSHWDRHLLVFEESISKQWKSEQHRHDHTWGTLELMSEGALTLMRSALASTSPCNVTKQPQNKQIQLTTNYHEDQGDLTERGFEGVMRLRYLSCHICDWG